MLEGIQFKPTWDNIYEACEGNQTNFNMKLFYVKGIKTKLLIIFVSIWQRGSKI